MSSEIGMGYKLVVFEDEYHTRVETEITGFSDASYVSKYRDHSQYAGKPSEIQIDYNNYLDNKKTDCTIETYTDDVLTPEPPRQVVKYYGKAPFNPVTFILAVVIVVIAVVLSCPALMLVFRL